MQHREIFSDLAQGSAAREANIASYRVALRLGVVAEDPISEVKSASRFRELTTFAGRVVLAGLTAGAGFILGGGARPVEADINQPVRYVGQDGRIVDDAPLREEGSGVLLFGPQGVEVCGVPYPGPAVVGIIANEAEMNVKAVGNPEIYGDPLQPSGVNYPSRAASIMDRVILKATEVVQRTGKAVVSKVAIIKLRDALNQEICDLVGSEIVTTTPAPVLQPVSEVVTVPVARDEVCVGIAEGVPATHGAVPVGKLDESAPQGTWFRPIYNQAEADAAHNWRGIGPWAPISFASEPGAAHLKTFGNLGMFVVVGDAGGKVLLGFWQQAQHQNETKMRPDGKLDPSWKNQYTIDGLPAGAPVIPFDPDTGKQLTWPEGTPIEWAAGPLGTFSVELPEGEVRFGLCLNVPGQMPGIQPPELKVYRGPNDQPRLKGENVLPNTSQVVKPGMPD